MEEQDWAEVVAAATRAPSIHNTQPWLFVARAESLELHLDRERALPVLDPSGRQQIISCGVAVELALVALRGAGHEAHADLLPDPADPDHLATVRVGARREPSAGDRALVRAIDDRHTVRAPFQAKAVPEELVRAASMIGPESYVAERIAAFRAAGVTTLNVQPLDGSPEGRLRTVETMKKLAG